MIADPNEIPVTEPAMGDKPAPVIITDHVAVDSITGDQIKQGLSVFAQILTAAFAVGSPVVGLLENTVPTKTAGLIIGGASALTYVVIEGLHATAGKVAVALHLMRARG